jgi:molecular chaperone DnaJ
VPRSASSQEIRRAYRRLARRYSPDINLWDEQAAGLFAEIDEAYRVLGDPATRALYDRLGHQAFEPPREPATERPVQGEDLHYPIEIELEAAVRGTQALIEVSRLEPCQGCDGTGGVGGQRAERCRACAGRPVRMVVKGDVPIAVECEACRGAGWRLPEPCAACGGRGTISRLSRIPVSIPPGVDTGAQIRLPGQGHAAPAPGRRGDLVVITRIRPHPVFTRKGDSLYCELPVSVPEAALGARIRIPTLDGPAVFTVPAGTQSGQVFRIRGKGCPRLGRDGRGDLLVAARVVIPRNTDSTLEEVLRALERLLPGDPRAELWTRCGAAP